MAHKLNGELLITEISQGTNFRFFPSSPSQKLPHFLLYESTEGKVDSLSVNTEVWKFEQSQVIHLSESPVPLKKFPGIADLIVSINRQHTVGSSGVSISVQETANLGPWDCHLGFMGLPFGVHGTAVWGPCDRHLGSVGLPFRVHGAAISDPMWLPYEGNSTAVLWFLGKPLCVQLYLSDRAECWLWAAWQ